MHRARVVLMRQIGIEQFDRQRITKTFGSRNNLLCCAGRVRRNRDAMPGKQSLAFCLVQRDHWRGWSGRNGQKTALGIGQKIATACNLGLDLDMAAIAAIVSVN